MEVQSVQEIASQSLNIIPSEFIRTQDEHPEITTLHGEFLQVPVIDIGSDSDMVRKISEASTEWGIFQAVNHGIPENVIGKLKRAGEEFFELPLEEKLLVAADPDVGGKLI